VISLRPGSPKHGKITFAMCKSIVRRARTRYALPESTFHRSLLILAERDKIANAVGVDDACEASGSRPSLVHTSSTKRPQGNPAWSASDVLLAVSSNAWPNRSRPSFEAKRGEGAADSAPLAP
jgi:hypothetical protein